MTMILLMTLSVLAWLLALVWAGLEFYSLAAPWLSAKAYGHGVNIKRFLGVLQDL